VARRNREAQHIPQRTRIVVGDAPVEVQSVRRNQWDARDHGLQRGDPALMLGVFGALDHVTIEHLSTERNLHLGAYNSKFVELLGHPIVEQPIQVRG
jgi:hypothetical protein